MIRRFALLTMIGLLANSVSQAQAPSTSFNVRTFGAMGDGKADDTAAVQKGIDAAAELGGEIFLPAGIYRITQTLVMDKLGAHCVKVRGQGGSPYGGARQVRLAKATTLLWDGDEGGTLWRTTGAIGSSWRNLNFDGAGKAGILFLVTTEPSWGNMLNSMSHVHFFNADVGIQMAQTHSEHNCSDFLFEFITFGTLKKAFYVKNDQGVDFLFNYLFALNCGTVFDFERGGNLMVNTAQLTNSRLFLNIQGGGRNAGTFVASNVRIESSGGGSATRFQLLRSYPMWKQATIKFIGYDDCQWAWNQNKTESRLLPLMDIGPGTVVSVDSSIFNGPVARLTGEADASASLIMRECSFGFTSPDRAVAANEYGQFKLLNNFADKMRVIPDVVKWPEPETLRLPMSSPYAGADLVKNAE